MNCWYIIAAYSLLCLIGAYLPAVSSNVIMSANFPTTPCTGCLTYPSADSPHNGVSSFTSILNLNNSAVVIGAKHYLITFSVDGTFLRKLQVNSTEVAFQDCKRRNYDKAMLCPNVINLLIQHKDLIILCGTNSNKPNCWQVNVTTESNILKPFEVNEYYPKQRVVYLKTDQYLFTAYQDSNNKGRLIKVDINSPKVFFKRRFTQETSPHFVSLYEFGDYIYYFFSEMPEEVILDKRDKELHSRVGRLCKYDTGGALKDTYRGRMILFANARLMCEQPASQSSQNVPIHYNYLEKTSFVKSENGQVYIYGVFKSSPDSLVSAICRFSLSAIDSHFDDKQLPFYNSGTKSPRDKNDPRFLKCDSSLKTQDIPKTQANFAFGQPLASTALRSDGNQPVFKLHSNKPHITSENVPTKLGPNSYHVIKIFDSNVMLAIAVAVKQSATAHVIYQINIDKKPLDISEVKKVKNNTFVAAEEKVIIVPDVFCHAYNSCRDCVATKNPHCAWNQNLTECTNYDHFKSSSYDYRQDIIRGDYSEVCQKEKASCELSLKKLPTFEQEVVMSCKLNGVPKSNVTWGKDGQYLSVGSNTIMRNGEMVEEKELIIKKYGLDDAGEYTCHVSNGVTNGICSVILPGSKPQLKCNVFKVSTNWSLTCSATGYPPPTIACEVFDNSRALMDTSFKTNIEISQEKRYRFVAYNPFGVMTSSTFQTHSTAVVFVILKDWKPSYAEIGNKDYSELALNLTRGVRKLYKDNEPPIFGGISNITFRKGSVVAYFTLNGLINPSFQENQLTLPLTNAINKGRLGDLAVMKYDDEDDTDVDTESTSKPLTSTKKQTYPPTSNSSPGTENVNKNEKAQSSGCSCSGDVKVGIIVFVLTVVVVVVVILVCFCCIKRRPRKLWAWFTRNIPCCNAEGPNDVKEKSVISPRQSKERESKTKLLQDTDGKKQINNRNEPKNSKRSSQLAKDGSVEIEIKSSHVIENCKEKDETENNQSKC